MMTFSDLQWEPHHAGMGGIQARAFFANGYGASVIQFPYSYGGDKGLYELAVLVGNASDWALTYETPITNEVMGHLSAQEVSDLLDRISTLPTRPDNPRTDGGTGE